ncbi:Aminopeptidase 2 mitochondrial [Sorochytrium milnesiophthora]
MSSVPGNSPAYRQVPREEEEDLGDDIFEPTFLEKVTHFFSSNMKRCFIPLFVALSVLIVIMLAVLLAVRPREIPPDGKASWNEIRLPTDVVPHHYDLNITTILRGVNDSKWFGAGAIHLEVVKATDIIVVHANHLDVSDVVLHHPADNANITLGRHEISKKNQYHVFVFNQKLKTDNYTLSFNFAGNLTDNLRGFYLSKYENDKKEQKLLATTQFESTDARRAFPCFDEPALKATFKIRMTAQKGLHALSNMNIVNKYAAAGHNNHDFTTYEFADTKRMSTYLVAFVVSDFESVSTETKRGVAVSVWTQPGQKHLGKYALDAAAKIIDFYEELFAVEYPLPKSDLISIPDFAAGAMENWGLITYRDTALLYDEKQRSVANMQRVVTVVAHELGHQWFGNLVTMDWWDSLWLNEGFATFCEYFGANSVEPQLRLLEQTFIADSVRALSADSSEHTHPIHAKVTDPAEIQELFDAISYSKGGSVLRMLKDYLETTTASIGARSPFFAGLHNYLLAHAYANAKTEDLWDALTVEGVDVRTLMRTWTEQPGYPLLTFAFEKGANDLSIKQNRFFASPFANGTQQTWMVPLTFAVYSNESGKPELKGKTQSHIIEASNKPFQVSVPSVGRHATRFIKPNVQQKGFYRFHLPDDMVQSAADWLQKDPSFLEPLDKAGILEDNFALLLSGKTETPELALELTRYLAQETDYIVWRHALTCFAQLNHLYSTKSGYGYYRSYVVGLLDEVVRDLGWSEQSGSKPKDADLRSVLRASVLGWAVRFGHKSTVNEALAYFDKLKAGKSVDLQSDVLTSVYEAAVIYNDEEGYNYVYEQYLNTQFSADQQRYLAALARAQQPYLIQRNIEVAFGDKVRLQDKVRFLENIVAGSPLGPTIVFEHLRDNWDTIMRNFGSGGTFSSINALLLGLASSFTSPSMIGEAQRMFEDASLQKPPRSEETIQRGLETAKANVWWINKYGARTLEWFRHAVEHKKRHSRRAAI